MSGRVRVNRDSFDLRHAETSARVGDDKTYLTLGHIWARQLTNIGSTENITNEATVGAGLKITDRWSVRADAIYNWAENKFLRHGGTLFYNHPCYYLSLGYRTDNSVYEDYHGNTTIQFRFGISIEGQHY